ncbi:MAG: hypothetical protein H0W58_08410 [Acidobacteria bacterium]|nr:hypothetical protein [Acidobacteriota bacterium]
MLDNLTKTEQGEQVREFKYDSLSRLTRQKLAEQSASLSDDGQYVGVGAGRWSEAFWYDNRSNITINRDARGVTTWYSYQINGAYDAMGNQTRAFSPDGQSWLRYEYDGRIGLFMSRTITVQCWKTTLMERLMPD